jgi:predicted alpha/beta-fold hydrolase
MMQLIASDDFLVYKAFQGRLAYCLANPNVMVVESKCGGHLGWHEAPPRNYGLGKSWADAATTDFIDVVFKSFEKRKSNKSGGVEFQECDTVLSATVPRSKL